MIKPSAGWAVVSGRNARTGNRYVFHGTFRRTRADAIKVFCAEDVPVFVKPWAHWRAKGFTCERVTLTADAQTQF